MSRIAADRAHADGLNKRAAERSLDEIRDLRIAGDIDEYRRTPIRATSACDLRIGYRFVEKAHAQEIEVVHAGRVAMSTRDGVALLLAHAPERLHEEISNDYRDMIYAATRGEVGPGARRSSANGA